ncbi:MAG: hypothetical protein ACHQ1D_02920 [Nitrososphaerales archaeon]
MDIEEKYAWSKKGKKYKTKYFAALGQLFGDRHDKECQVSSDGRSRTDQISYLDDQSGNKVLCDS